MNYTETLQTVDTLKALKLLGIEAEQKGAYIYFPCSCGNTKVIKAYGEKKNVYYCPKCKDSGHIIKLVTEIMNAKETEKSEIHLYNSLLN
jgi:predicted SprT family Zn-dependent metalloprotease